MQRTISRKPTFKIRDSRHENNKHFVRWCSSMKPSQTIFNRDQGTVTISEKEYNKLLQYRELCREFKAVLGEGGAK